MAEPRAEAVDHVAHAPTRRQLLLGTRLMLATAAASVLVAGWNAYRDRDPRRGARSRRRKWKWGVLALLWFGLAYWSERRQRSSSSS